MDSASAKKKLRKQLFVDNFILTKSTGKAAVAAGYSEKSKNAGATRMMADPDVQAEIERRLNEVQQQAQIDATYVISSLKSIAERCQQTIPLVDKMGKEIGEDLVDGMVATKALQLLGDHLGLFVRGKGVVDQQLVIDLSTRVVQVIDTTVPSNCPHCGKDLQVREKLSQKIMNLSTEN